MSTATEQARSTRSEVRAFADAFSAADDAFTFGETSGESRTVTLAELEAVLELDAPVDVAPERPLPVPAAAQAQDGDLLTLEELGKVLAAPSAPADALDFDFGSGTERARRRTAARTGGSTPAAPPTHPVSEASAPRLAPIGARHAVQAPPPGSSLLHQPLAPPERERRGHGRRLTAAGAQRGAEVAPRPLPGAATLHRFRADPDRIALYAVLLGIVLVLIAASSSSA